MWRDGSVVWKLRGFNNIFEAGKRAEEIKSKNEKVPTDFCSPIVFTGSRGYSLYGRLFPFGCEVAAGNHVCFCCPNSRKVRCHSQMAIPVYNQDQRH